MFLTVFFFVRHNYYVELSPVSFYLLFSIYLLLNIYFSRYHIDLPEDYPINVKFLRTLAMDDDADNDQGGHYAGNKQDIITYSLWPISTLTSGHFSLRGNFQDQSDNLEKLILFNPELQTLRKLFKIDGKGWISLRSFLDFESNREHIFQVYLSIS